MATLLVLYPALFVASAFAPGESGSASPPGPVVWVSEDNMARDAQTGLLHVTFPPVGNPTHTGDPPPEIPNGGRGTVAVTGEAGDLLRRWLAEGTAAVPAGELAAPERSAERNAVL